MMTIKVIESATNKVLFDGDLVRDYIIAGDFIEFGSLTYQVTKRVFKDNGDLFIYVSQV